MGCPDGNQDIRPPRPESHESLWHSVDHERFLWDFRKAHTTGFQEILSEPRLQRYIGVIYRPETERASQYSHATLLDQYDAFVWFDKTRAVTPLATLSNTKEDETYPFAL
jgi:putative phosphoribosyl transferase